MDDLISIIKSLKEHEVVGFTAFAKARNKRAHNHLLTLFKLINDGRVKDLDQKIYGKPNRGALYAVKNRLKSSLIDFLGIHGFEREQKVELLLLKRLLAARILMQRNVIKVAWSILEKGSITAQRLELYTLNHEFLLTQLQHIHLLKGENLKILEQRFEENKSLCELENNLSLFFATVKTQQILTPDAIEQELRQRNITVDHRVPSRSYFQILEILTDAATHEVNYFELAPMALKVERLLEGKEVVNRDGDIWTTETLYLLALINFRTGCFEKSQELLCKLDELDRDTGNSEKVLVLKALNLNYTNRPIDCQQLLTAIKKPSFQTQLIVLMIMIQHGEPFRAGRLIKTMGKSFNYYAATYGSIWAIKREIAAIITYTDCRLYDLAEKHLTSLQKRLSDRPSIAPSRLHDYLRVVKNYLDNPLSPDKTSLMNQLLVLQHPMASEDVITVSVYAWLKARINKADLYHTTLDTMFTPA
ncbi:MAG: hypothetical protein WBA16_01175 [Nonlabens sp.]